MEANFTIETQEFIRISKDEAIRLNPVEITLTHLILGMIEYGKGLAFDILGKLCDVNLLKKALEHQLSILYPVKSEWNGHISLTKTAEKALKVSYLEAKLQKHDFIDPFHVLLAILRLEDEELLMLSNFGVTYDSVRELVDAKTVPERDAAFPKKFETELRNVCEMNGVRLIEFSGYVKSSNDSLRYSG